MIVRLSAAILGLIGATCLHAQTLSEDPCSQADIRTACSTSCYNICTSDSAFLLSNVTWCSTKSAAAATSVGIEADSPICSQIFSIDANASAPGSNTAVAESVEPATVQNGATAVVPAPEAAATELVLDPVAECDALPRRSDQLRCLSELIAGRPTCSSNVPELEDRAGLLTIQVSNELSSYGELLALDLSEVSSRDRLCEFTLDELDANYSRASEEPENLRAIQVTARQIQDCQSLWQTFVRERPGTPGVPDPLQDDVARDLAAQLLPLQVQLVSLNDAILNLGTAAVTIDGLIAIHIDFCRAEGSASATQNN